MSILAWTRGIFLPLFLFLRGCCLAAHRSLPVASLLHDHIASCYHRHPPRQFLAYSHSSLPRLFMFMLLFPCIRFVFVFLVFFCFCSLANHLRACFATLHPLPSLSSWPLYDEPLTPPALVGFGLHAIGFSLYCWFFSACILLLFSRNFFFFCL